MNTLIPAVVHDVKNRLAELALRLERQGNAGAETSLVLEACTRLTELLLALRSQSGQLQANVDSASPSDMIRELVAEYRAMFAGIDITEDGTNAPLFAFYDVSLVRLALANAMHNACRHARSAVRVSAYSDAGFLVFEIRDDGTGFPDNILQHALDVPLPVSQTGTGLGLWLAREIAAQHQLQDRHGDVQLQNAGGACFRMRLP